MLNGDPDELTKMSRAHYRVALAVRTGVLVRPTACEECGSEPPPNRRGAAQIQAHHHNGYEDPLDVQWLCPTCHLKENRKAYAGLPVEPDPLGSILD